MADQKNKVPFAGAEDSHRPWKEKMKQRSFYMDDETYGLIEKHAEKLGASNGTALRMIVRKVLLDEGAAPVSQPALTPAHQSVRDGTFGVQSASAGQREGDGAHAIVLPPDNQESFVVPPKFRERGPRTPRPVHEDDDF